ncbi:MAG: radical SAM protein [Bacillota bacterium]
MSLATSFLGEAVLKPVFNYVSRDPEKSLPALLKWVEKIPFHPNIREAVRAAGKALQDPDNNWHQLAIRVLKNTHPRVKERLIINFFLNAWLLGVPRQREITERTGVNIPFAIVLSTTARCNLRCTGCWAADYDRQEEMDFATLDRICREAKELGIYLFVITGGEPLVRKDDLFNLAARHPDLGFHVYTNGTLVDERVVDDALRCGNIGFAFSLEGFRETTDARRGKGVYDKIMKGMDMMREAGLLFGFSGTYTRQNTEEVGSDEFLDHMIAKGCTFGWYFTYVPVGSDVDLQLMATPAQRAFMYEQVIKKFRQTKPIFVVDFWSDGPLAHGCIAGGRRYLHINAAGDVEPCAFVHYSSGNIKTMSLLQALDLPLMRAYRSRQPFNDNLLRPCPIIDNPPALAEMVEETGAYPTQLNPGNARELGEALKDHAAAWGEVADAIWERDYVRKLEKAAV